MRLGEVGERLGVVGERLGEVGEALVTMAKASSSLSLRLTISARASIVSASPLKRCAPCL